MGRSLLKIIFGYKWQLLSSKIHWWDQIVKSMNKTFWQLSNRKEDQVEHRFVKFEHEHG